MPPTWIRARKTGWEIETQAAYWRRCVLAARKAGLGRADYCEVRYEDLVLNTRETLKAICKFVDLTHDETMLSYYKRAPRDSKNTRDAQILTAQF
jgi:hypothetical protein